MELPARLELAPSVWKTDILPLRRRKHLATLTGFEPASAERQSTRLPIDVQSHKQSTFLKRRSTVELRGHMATPTGLEPAISCVTGRRVNHLHHGVVCWRPLQELNLYFRRDQIFAVRAFSFR